MRITFDSNAWESVFDLTNSDCEPIRVALAAGLLKGFVCESAFRIEAIKKGGRVKYFQSPKMETKIRFVPGTGGGVILHCEFGPADEEHPGLPEIQARKLETALKGGVRLIHGMSWLGLPRPLEINDPGIYVKDAEDERDRRSQCQADLSQAIRERGVGRTAFEALGGWTGDLVAEEVSKKFQRACAEWSDGETVIAHVSYQNDILCTNDFGMSAGKSIFDSANRAWLTDTYNVRFATLQHLIEGLPS